MISEHFSFNDPDHYNQAGGFQVWTDEKVGRTVFIAPPGMLFANSRDKTVEVLSNYREQVLRKFEEQSRAGSLFVSEI